MSPYDMRLVVSAGAAVMLGSSAMAQEIGVFGPPTLAYEGQRTLVTSEASLRSKRAFQAGQKQIRDHD